MSSETLDQTGARDLATSLTGVPSLIFDHEFESSWGIAAPEPRNGVSYVYVTDFFNHVVHVFDGATGKLVFSFGSEGDGPEEFDGPTGITVVSHSDHDEVYIGDNWNHRVQVWQVLPEVGEASFLRSICPEGEVGELNDPEGICIDPIRQKVYVCDCYNHCVSVFSTNPSTLDEFVLSLGLGGGSGPGRLLKVTGVAVNNEMGLVAIGDVENPCVSIFTSDGQFVASFGHGNPKKPKGYFGPQGFKFLATDPQSGHLIVVDGSTCRVHVFTWDGEWVGGFGAGMPNKGPVLTEVYGVAVSPTDGKVYLCAKDSDLASRVMCF